MVTDEIRGEMQLVVVPQSMRPKVLEMAHEKGSHLGHTKKLLPYYQGFIW